MSVIWIGFVGFFSVSYGRYIALVGLGYVELTVAVPVARAGAPFIGFDNSQKGRFDRAATPKGVEFWHL